MILVVDSGSTKTDWRVLLNGRIICSIDTKGLNPFFVTENDIVTEAKKILNKDVDAELVKKIFFYGAGCRSEEKKLLIINSLKQVFKNSLIEVESDVLGAAISLFGDKKGIAAILGTGTNACVYNGSEITKNTNVLGYILGDEGSGAFIGKKVVQAFMNDELPYDISEKFTATYKLSKDDIIEAVYRKPFPNRFLASFAKFVSDNKCDNFFKELLGDSFSEFFDKHICKLKGEGAINIGIVGSIAYFFKDEIKSIADEKGLTISKIVKSPIDELALYYSKKN